MTKEQELYDRISRLEAVVLSLARAKLREGGYRYEDEDYFPSGSLDKLELKDVQAFAIHMKRQAQGLRNV